jgi:hypothetical protein
MLNQNSKIVIPAKAGTQPIIRKRVDAAEHSLHQH